MAEVILVIDDQADIRLSSRLVLATQGYDVVEAQSPVEAMEQLTSGVTVNLILLDMNFSTDTTSGEEGLSFLKELKKLGIDIPIIAMTAWSNVALAVKAMQLGARDFIEKPWKNQRLLQIIKQQLLFDDLKQENLKLKQQQSDYQKKPEMVWQSTEMQALFTKIGRLAKSDATILITGDNGTGKSTIAKYIHQMSNRASENLIAVNMGAIPETLFESEMFGHRKGAFTDAKSDRIGRFELAEKGTLFLDEIANIPITQQAKLLRVLEDGEFERIGASQSQQSDIRLICATNGDISALINEGRFRSDLYFRMNTLEVHVPSLSERPVDIIPLAEHFLKKWGQKYSRSNLSLSEAAKTRLMSYHWPGNVRELGHIIERAVLLAEHSLLTDEDLELKVIPENTLKAEASPNAQQSSLLMTIEATEVALIKSTLKHYRSNVSETAISLGITTSALYRRMEKYGISKSFVE
jgi:DNA-binding NtrC family response regulator